MQRYRRSLLRYCRSMRLSDARAEDVLQQVFLQAWLALARGTEVRDLKAWLYRIVHNAAVNATRGASERPHSELTDVLQASAASVGESELERHVAVRDALGDVAALPQMQRQAIFLTAFDGQSHEEVASALGITHGALRGLLYRARSTLRSAAAALTPPPLLAWASGGEGAGRPTAERLAELTAGAGGAGMAGLFLKGAVVAVTAGAVATGATVVQQRHHGTRHPAGRQSATLRAGASASASAGSAGPGASAAIAAAPQIGTVGGSKSVRHRGSGRRRRGVAGTRHQARHDHHGSAEGNLLGAGSGDGRGRAGTQRSASRGQQVSDNGRGRSSGGSDGRDRGGTGDNGGGSSHSSSDGSREGSGVAATGPSGSGSGSGGESQSASDGGESGQATASEAQSGGDHNPATSDESSVKQDG